MKGRGGQHTVWRVEREENGRAGRLEPVVGSPASHPAPSALYQGDSYVIQYSGIQLYRALQCSALVAAPHLSRT